MTRHPALALTEEMLGAARMHDWRRVAELEHRRRPTLDAVADGGAQLVDLLRARNAELATLAVAFRSKVEKRLLELRHGHRARRAYRTAAA